jgi:hypothetical protein
MKANDLMVGDYISVKPSGMPIKVAAVHHKKVAYHAVVNKLEWVRESLLEPIPLTPDILEKNGWFYNNEDEKFFPQTWVGGGLMLQGADDCGYCIVVTSDYDDEDTNVTPFIILYIHELQHALRLRRIKKEIKL